MTSFTLLSLSFPNDTQMPPRRQADTQQSLETFFASPNAKGKGKVGEKVKGKGKTEEVIDLETDEEDDVVCVGGSSQITKTTSSSNFKPKAIVKAERIQAAPPPATTSKKRPRETTPPPDPASKLFIAQTPTKRRVPPSQTMGLQSPHGTEKVKDEPLVKIDPNPAAPTSPTPLDLDTDPLTFDPRLVDVRAWSATGGRLPYEVLVEGVYLPVAGTRSRLAIGRVLCK